MRECLKITKEGSLQNQVLYPPDYARESTIGWALWSWQVRFEKGEVYFKEKTQPQPTFNIVKNTITLTVDSDYNK